MTNTQKFAVAAVRRWQSVPEKNEDGTPMTDEQAVSGGFVTPEMIELIMLVVNQLLTRCLDNQRQRAWRRVRGFLDSNNEFNRMADNVLLLRNIDLWVGKLAIPRETGDVKAIRQSLVETAKDLTQDDFGAIQDESLFLAI